LTIRNVPESVIQGRISTRGRIKYHFLVFGELSLLVIEVKFRLGTGDERLNAIAQVIAECDGMHQSSLQIYPEYLCILACDYSNDHLGLNPPKIYAVLCDGTSFEFFSFESGNPKPTFSRGVFRTSHPQPYERLSTADYHATSLVEYIRSLRPICETLFYFLLLTFNAGLEAFTTRSVECGINEARARKSTPNWAEAQLHAKEALRLAVDAAERASNCDDAADGIVETAFARLKQRLALLCFHLT
jgi:hypothetical protein